MNSQDCCRGRANDAETQSGPLPRKKRVFDPYEKDLCHNRCMDLIPLHFFDQAIEVIFDTPPLREKAPDCPNGFIWEDQTYRILEMLSSWTDFKRRGKMARNMRPEHATVAATRGSLNVGRYYFRVLVMSSSSIAKHPSGTAGQSDEQIFDIYYDRAMKSLDDRKGQWFVYRELGKADGPESINR